MDRVLECARLATMLGWRVVDSLEGLLELGVSDSVYGEHVWLYPEKWKGLIYDNAWVRELPFEPWQDANDDLLLLEHFRDLTPEEFGDYKDCLYHETRGHGTHAIWNYRKGKFANASIMWLNR